jgi:glycosyltransferase involved in cell wall biosynthesis
MLLRTPGETGLSRGRNIGWRHASGKYIIFADDDCWYPPTLFERVAQLFQSSNASFISGRAANEAGRSINGRFKSAPQVIGRSNVWTTSIEWMVFFRREVLEKVGGFDETIGLGASTPWQAAEGQDIVLRALSEGFSGYFDPSLIGHHPEIRNVIDNEAMRCKARAYARGMGFVLRRHGYGIGSLVSWVGRPFIAAMIYGLLGKQASAYYYRETAIGRVEGWLNFASNRTV